VSGRRRRAGQGYELRLALAVEDGLDRRRFPLLAGKHSIEPFRHQLLPHTSDHRDVGVERAANLFIGPALASFALDQLSAGCVSFRMVLAEAFPFEISSLNRLRSSPLNLTTNLLFAMSRPPCRIFATGQESVFAVLRNNIF
jgi:hypothetical protein